MKVQNFPDLDLPTVTIVASLPGAAPAQLETEVARKIEVFEIQKAKLEEQTRNTLLKKGAEHEKALASFKEVEQALLNENMGLREQYKAMKNGIEDATRLSLEQKEASHILEIQRLRETLEGQARERVEYCHREQKESIETMRKFYEEQLAKERKELEKTVGSSNIGNKGEKEFADLVSLHTDWAKVQNVSKTAHSTDMRCKIRSCSALFELKKYAEDDVPSKEVAKFERDMEENEDCPLGVFISLHTNIVGKKSGNFITSAWTPKSQLLIYINSFYHHAIEDIFPYIDMCADFAWKIFKSARDTPEESEILTQLQSRIEQAKIYIEKDLKRMGDLITKMNHNKKFLISSIEKQTIDCIGDIRQSRGSLQTMLEVLLGKCQEDEVVPEDIVSPVIAEESAVVEETPKKKGGARKKAPAASASA